MTEWEDDHRQDGDDDYEGLEGIAIIGMSGRFPGARDLDAFWRNLRDGMECVSRLSDEEILATGVPPEMISHPKYVKARGLLDDVDLFDAAFFDFSPREAELLDPQHRLFLEVAWEALERAGYDPQRVGGPVGVYAGMTVSSYLLHNLYANPEVLRAAGGYQVGLGTDKDFIATRVSYKLDLRGPSVNVQSACSTSLVATVLACQGLLGYQCDLAIAGGASIRVPQHRGYMYAEGGLDSSDGHCRAFDAKADGSVYGSGVGAVVLKRLDDALADGDPIEAVILGGATNNDGSAKVGFTAPSIDGQSEVITTAQALAGIDPATITYVETHGTGTALGDPIEISALTRAFGATGELPPPGSCRIGSVKPNIGHLSAAAGIAGLTKAVLALKHRQLPPSLHFERPNPKIDFASTPFVVNDRLCDWDAEYPRRTGVSSFGLGGTNAHVVVEEAPEPEPSGPSRRHQLVPLSARSENALERMCERLAAHLGAHPELPLADVAHTLQVGRKVFEHRRMLVASDAEDARRVLEERDPKRLLERRTPPGRRGVAFLFSGLGDHYPGMGRGLYETEPAYRDSLDRAAHLLREELGWDLLEVLHPEGAAEAPEGTDLRRMLGRGAGGGEDDEASRRLGRTSIVQPALFAVEVALAELWREWGIEPEAVIGYSLGEYAAACVAGVISFDDALRLVARRARLIEALPEGAMLAVSLPREEVEPRLASPAGEGLDLAAVNGPHLSVVAGSVPAVERLQAALEADGVACRRLPNRHAFHSRMMAPVAEHLAELASSFTFSAPRIPLLSNLTGDWLSAEEAVDPTYWARHLCGTVRFDDGLAAVWSEPSRLLLEIGPGQGLTSLALQHPAAAPDPEAGRKAPPRLALPSLRGRYEGGDDQAFLLAALGKLWLAGVEVSWEGFYRREKRRRVQLPTYPFERKRYWVEPTRDLASLGSEAASGTVTGGSAAGGPGLYLPTWRPSPPRPPAPEPPAGTWLVLADDGSLGARLAEHLAARGGSDVRVVRAERGESCRRLAEDRWQLRPEVPEGFSELLAVIPAPIRVIHAWSLHPAGAEATGESGASTLEASGWNGLLPLVQALQARDADADLRFLSRGLLSVTGEEQVDLAAVTLLGVCEALAGASPKLACSGLDLGSTEGGERLVERLLDELSRPAERGVFALRGARRWQRDFELLPPASAGVRLRADGHYLIAGHHASMSLELARWLAARGRPRLLIAGPRAGMMTAAAGGALVTAEAHALTVELTTPDGWRALEKEVADRELELDGVFHVTATAAGEPLDDLGRELASLAETVAGAGPAFCLLLTDPSGVETLPNPLRSAARVAVLRGWAGREAARGQVPWTAVTRSGQGSAEAAVAALDQLLGLEPVSSAVLVGAATAATEPAAKPAAARHARPELATAFQAPEGEVEHQLTEIWEELLGIEGIGVHDSFFELGGHSLQGTVLLSRLRDTFGIELPLRALFEGPTIAELARAVLAAQIEKTGEQSVAELLEELEGMTDEGAAELLETGTLHEV